MVGDTVAVPLECGLASCLGAAEMELVPPGCTVPVNHTEPARDSTPPSPAVVCGPEGTVNSEKPVRLTPSCTAHPFQPNDSIFGSIFESQPSKRRRAEPPCRIDERARTAERKRKREEEANAEAAAPSQDLRPGPVVPVPKSRAGERQRQAEAKRRRIADAEAERVASAARAVAAASTPAARIMARIKANVVAKCVAKSCNGPPPAK